MKHRLLQWLVCPECRGALDLAVQIERDGEVEEGVLRCGPCRKDYPVSRGIPRFVPPENYAASFGRQWNKFARLQLDSRNGTSFSRQRFYSITEWDPGALQGKLVLDAGCGAGRFAEVALQAGAEVVAVDLSSAVDACRQNLSAHRLIHWVQASLYELPFRDGTFDYVYCIGVIQHTPDPKRSVLSLLPKAAIGGKTGLWIYELNWKAFVGASGFKYLLRPWTRRLPHARLERFCEQLERLCWPITRRARRTGKLGWAVMRLLPVACAHLHGVPLSDEDFREWVVLDTFDAYSPAHDHPQRFTAVRRWMENAGYRPDARHPHGAISITGTRLR
jgi:2-polyprenyl-3-methyl-5-hydroxy-6-metoxy-1,4-benzoquinol methylase